MAPITGDTVAPFLLALRVAKSPAVAPLVPRQATTTSATSTTSTSTSTSTSTFTSTEFPLSTAAPPYIPDAYTSVDSELSPGGIVGIVIGSIAGFLLLLWMVHICLNIGKPPILFSGTLASRSRDSLLASSHRHRHRHSKSHSSRHKHHRHGRRRETIEIHKSERVVSTPPRPRDPEVIKIVESSRRNSRPAKVVFDIAPSESTSSSSDSTLTEDVVIVPPPPPAARRNSRRSSGQSYRRESGYREIRPGEFAGGDSPMREVRRSRH